MSERSFLENWGLKKIHGKDMNLFHPAIWWNDNKPLTGGQPDF